MGVFRIQAISQIRSTTEESRLNDIETQTSRLRPVKARPAPSTGETEDNFTLNERKNIALKSSLPLVVCMLVLGQSCWADAIAPLPTKNSPSVIWGLRRDNDSKFSKAEKELITVARHYEEERTKATLDAYYKITLSTKGYDVYIQFVAGYRSGQPSFYPGGFCVVRLDKRGKVIGDSPGA